MEAEEARRVVSIYRDANWNINTLWRDCQNMLVEMSRGTTISLGPNGIVRSVETQSGMGILLPSGLVMRYDDLGYEQGERGPEFSYKTRRGRTRIYGGKVTENVCQAIARCIIGEQMLAIAKKYKVALTVHDSVVCCVPKDELKEATAFIEGCMSTTPSWAEGLPITCESDSGESYGEAAG
jgi:DNA polymerase